MDRKGEACVYDIVHKGEEARARETMSGDDSIPHLPRYVITGDAGDTLDYEIVRALRPPAVAARLNPLEDAAVLEHTRSRIASFVDDEIRRHKEAPPEMAAKLRASLDKYGSAADAYARRTRA